jgi:hypothetical protein
MRKWLTASVVFGVLPIVGTIAMFLFSYVMANRRRAWEELDVDIGPVAQVAIYISDLWGAYWFLSLPLIILGISLAIAFAAIGFSRKPSTNTN